MEVKSSNCLDNFDKREVIIDELRKKRFRITDKRKLIIDIILNNECSSCKEIHYEAARINSAIGIATVYRMLTALEEIGAINKNSCYRITDDGINCLNCKCTVVLKNKKMIDIDKKDWEDAVKDTLCSIYPIDKEEIDSVLIEK